MHAGNSQTDYSNIYRGLVGTSTGMSVTGFGGTPSTRMYGSTPEAMVAAGNIFNTMDRYLYGTTNSSSGTRSGLGATTAAGYLSQVMQARGGIHQGEMYRFNMPGTSVAAQLQGLRQMQNRTNMTANESQQVYSNILTSQILEQEAQRTRAGRSYSSLEVAEQRKLQDEVRTKLRSMDEAGRRKFEQQVLEGIEAEYTRTHGAAAAREMMGELTASGAKMDLTEGGVARAVRTLEGRDSYARTSKEFDRRIEKSLQQAENTLAEMTDVFQTENFDELMRMANQFGVTTMASEQQVRKMRNVMDAAKARAASTGRTVQEVMVEYSQVASMAGGMMGGTRNMSASYLEQYNTMMASTAQNVASGFDTRTSEERLAEFNAQQANNMNYHRKAVWALEQGAAAGDPTMRKWLQRVQESANGGTSLTDAEYRLMLAEANRYAELNGAHNDSRAYDAYYANSALTNTLDRAAGVKRRTDFGREGARKITQHWASNDTAAGRALFGEGGMTREAAQSLLESAIFEFGGNNAQMQAYLGADGVFAEGIARHGGDVNAYIKELQDQMRQEGRSDAAIANIATLVQGMHGLTAEQRKHILDGIGGVQRDTRIGAGDQQLTALEAQAWAAKQQQAASATRGAITRAGSGDLATFLVRGQNSTVEGDFAATMFALSGKTAGSTLANAADGEILSGQMSALVGKSDQELLDAGFNRSQIESLRALGGVSYGMRANENGLFNWEAVKADSARNTALAAQLQTAIANETDPAKKEALQRQLDSVLGQQRTIETLTGMSAADIASREGMTDQELTSRVRRNATDAGMRMTKGNSGMVFTSDDSVIRAESDKIRRQKMVELAFGMSELTGVTESDLIAVKNGTASAAERESVIAQLERSPEIQRVLSLAEQTGERLTYNSSTGETALGTTNLRDKTARRRLLLDAALSSEGGSAAIMEAARNGSQLDVELWGQSILEAAGYGKDNRGFDYRAAGKGLDLDDNAMNTLRRQEDELQGLVSRLKAGERLSVEELTRAETLITQLDRATQGIRTKSDSDQVMIEGEGAMTLAQLREDGPDSSEATKALNSRNNEGAASVAEQAKADAEKQQRIEQEQTELRTSAIKLIKQLLPLHITPDGQLKVEL